MLLAQNENGFSFHITKVWQIWKLGHVIKHKLFNSEELKWYIVHIPIPNMAESSDC